MRLSKAVTIEGGLNVQVKELSGKEIRQLLAILKANKNKDIKALLEQDLGDVFSLFEGCLQYPEGNGFDDLAFSEIEEIGKAFWEVNRLFFQRIEQAIGVLGLAVPMPPIISTVSSGPAASSSNEATPTASSTDGASS